MAKVMISIPDALLKEIDAVAKAEHRKRSEFFKEIAMRYIRYFRQRGTDFTDLEAAATSGFDFWDNPIDDELWNATETT
jgi:metal-responsive CopG/Arc/MetJ family transcriptional regulator